MGMRTPSLILAVLTLGLSLNVTARTTAQPVTAAHIRSAAHDFLSRYAGQQKDQGRKVSFSVDQVDPRLRMAPCGDAIQVRFVTDPMAATHVTLQAACKGARPWRLFLGARIKIAATAYVAKVPLPRGAKIAPSNIEAQLVTINQSHGAIFDSTDGLVGMQLIRPIKAGTLLTSDLLEAPDVVARGDRVIIRAKVASIAVKTRGTALSDGQRGQQILVRNDRSKRTVKAVVIGPGLVGVPM